MDRIEMQKGLNDVVTNKVQRMIDRNQNNVKQTLQRLMSEHRSAQDFIAPIGVELKKKDTVPVIKFTEQGYITMNVDKNRYSLHPHAVGQLAEKMSIPAKYLRQLSEGSEWQRQLATQILNEHSGWTERTRVLVRAVGNQVRGVLSDSYRRLNSEQILTAFLTEAMSQGAVPCDAYMSDTKIWVETILPEPISIPTELNGTVVIYMGARFSTSDYGDGAVDMRAYLLNGVCLNGMVRESLMKQVHLGTRLPDNLMFSEKTYALDTETTMSATKDFTKNLYSRDNITRQAIMIQEASRVKVDFDDELKKLVKANKLFKSESESVQKLLMNNNPEDGLQGGPSLFKLTQGLTAVAREMDPTRSRELHEISGELMARIKK
mgnify:FL=1